MSQNVQVSISDVMEIYLQKKHGLTPQQAHFWTLNQDMRAIEIARAEKVTRSDVSHILANARRKLEIDRKMED